MAKEKVINRKTGIDQENNVAIVEQTIQTVLSAKDIEKQIAGWNERMQRYYQDFHNAKAKRDELQSLFDGLVTEKPAEELEV